MRINEKRVVAAMSGGVDSSVAAALLEKQGYEVIGLTMCFNLADIDSRKPRCCGPEGIEDARRVAAKIGIKHYVLNMHSVLEEKVVKDFCSEYVSGRTPNPCVRCNQFIKFGALLNKARQLGAKYLATGHYAAISEKEGKYGLLRAKDRKKDQSYFLYRLSQSQLKQLLFPLGIYTKEEVRALAKEFDLPVAQKKESQEICFLPGKDYRSFLQSRCGHLLRPGKIIDKSGRVLGIHKGVSLYTIGQREGLGISAAEPLYVASIEPRKKLITVGPRQDCFKSELIVSKAHFISGPVKKEIALNVKIRYNHKESEARVTPQAGLPAGKAGKIKIRFKKPQFAVTPGQSAVFYKNDRVLGGGIIEKVTG